MSNKLKRAAAYHSNHSDVNTLRKIQNFLAARGYYDGDVDGRFGKKTFTAIKGYQQDNKLDPDGIWGESTNSVHRVLNATNAPYRNDSSGESGAHISYMRGVNTGRNNAEKRWANQNEMYRDINALKAAYYNDGGEDWFWGNDPDATKWREFLHKTPEGQAILDEFYDMYTGDRTKLESRKLTSDQKVNNIRTVAGEKTNNTAKQLGTVIAAIPFAAEALAGGAATMAGAGLNPLLVPISGLIGTGVGGYIGKGLLERMNRNYHEGDNEVHLSETTPMAKQSVPVINGDPKTYYTQQGANLGQAIGSVLGGAVGPAITDAIMNNAYLLGRIGSRVNGENTTFMKSKHKLADVWNGIKNEYADLLYGHAKETYPRTAVRQSNQGVPLGETSDVSIPKRDILGRFTNSNSSQYDPLNIKRTYPSDTRSVGSSYSGGAGNSSVVRQGEYLPYDELTDYSMLWSNK